MRTYAKRLPLTLGLVILLGLAALALSIWACLYPLAALLAAGAWALPHVAGVSLLGELHGFNLISIRYILPTAVAIAVLWFASRWDHLLALKRGYRIARHCVRRSRCHSLLAIPALIEKARYIFLWQARCLTAANVYTSYSP